jgi:hypothetical protein
MRNENAAGLKIENFIIALNVCIVILYNKLWEKLYFSLILAINTTILIFNIIKKS